MIVITAMNRSVPNLTLKLPPTAKDFKIGNDLMTKVVLFTYGIGHNERRSYRSLGDARTAPINPTIKNIIKTPEYTLIEIAEKNQ